MDCDPSKCSIESSHQSNEVMCNLKKLSNSESGNLPGESHNSDSNYERDMTVKDPEHSSTSCCSSEADLSDADKQEVHENRQCPLCNEMFPNPGEYTLHLKKHTDGTKCLVCGKVLSSANSLDRHLLVHSGEKPFECEQCGKAFTTNGNMNRHKRKRKHTQTPAENPVSKKAKIIPVNTETPDSTSVSTSKGKLYNCDWCTLGFRNLVEIGLKPENFDLICRMDCERRRTCHCSVKGNNKSSSDIESSQICDTCGDVCLRMSNLLPKAHSGDLFLCKNCDSGFVSLSQFQLHKLKHEISNRNQSVKFDNENDENKASFLQMLGLISTKEINNIRELDNNKDNNEQFSNKEADITDQKINGEKSSKFEKSFNYSSTHTYESNTEVKNVSSAHQNNSSTEILTTSSIVSLSTKPTRSVTSPISGDCASPISNIVEGPSSPVEGSVASRETIADNDLQCKECGPLFNSNKTQTMHYCKLHLKKKSFPCTHPTCDYVSKDKSTLTRHMRKHTGEKPYMCIICSNRFTTETNARRHVKKVHYIFHKEKKHIECKSEKSSEDQGITICHYCRKDFGDPKLLTQHKNAPDCLGKAYICSECPFRFTTKNNCVRHMIHKHNMDKDQAKEAMIIDKFNPEDKKEDDLKYNKPIEFKVGASDDKAISDNFTITNLESVEEEKAEIGQDCSSSHHEGHETTDEVELTGITIDLSQNSCRLENEAIYFAHHNTDTVRQRPSSTEVDVSYSMLRLSEEMPYDSGQEEAMDLSISPIDLTVKAEKPKQNNKNVCSNFSHSMVPPPAHASPSVISNQSSHRNLLNFLNSTLPFSAFPSSAHFPAKSELFTLEMQSPTQKNFSVSSPRVEFPRQNVPCSNRFLIANTEDSNSSERELHIVEDAVIDDSGQESNLIAASSGEQQVNDHEINDLASVSSVIDTANSRDINKFLNTVTFNKQQSVVSEIGSISIVSKTNGSSITDNKKKFPCSRCERSFDTTSALKRHMLTHTKQKLHKCSICFKGFGTKSNCKRHELTHSTKNVQKPKDSANESQNPTAVSNRLLNYSNSSTSHQTDRYDQANELSQNSLSCSSVVGHSNIASNTFATFSHQFSETFGSYSKY